MSTLSRATRQLVVAHLSGRGMNPQEIAAELGVSRETVRRDLHNAEPAASTGAGTDVAAGVLVLCLDEPLRVALAVLRGRLGAPDTVVQNVAAARAAIRATADTVLEAHPEVAL